MPAEKNTNIGRICLPLRLIRYCVIRSNKGTELFIDALNFFSKASSSWIIGRWISVNFDMNWNETPKKLKLKDSNFVTTHRLLAQDFCTILLHKYGSGDPLEIYTQAPVVLYQNYKRLCRYANGRNEEHQIPDNALYG
ncbi:hypothetical protein D3C81_1317750 [compost metagenome]